MAKLTVKQLENLTAADLGTRLQDEHSLYGLVRSNRNAISVRFRWRYCIGGKYRDYNCGTWPAMSLKEIRDALEHARQAVAQGKDPNDAKRISRLNQRAVHAEAIAQANARIDMVNALQARITVNDLFERWSAVDLIRRKDGGKEIRRMFAKDVLPALGGLAVEDVRKGHITAVADALLARGVTRMAKLIFSLIRQMFRFAVDRDLIEHEPTAGIRKTRIGGKPTERDRVLTEDEIRALHRQISSAELRATTEAAVWLALSTGCRIGELLRAEWIHVRLEARVWHIPAENSKNGRPHDIHLSDFALSHFETLKGINGGTKCCFPNRAGTNSVDVKTVTKQISKCALVSPLTKNVRLVARRWQMDAARSSTN